MALKVTCDPYVDWGRLTVDELRAQIATGALPRKQLEDLLKMHVFSDEVSGWIYKYLYVRRDMFGNRVDNADKYTF